MIHDFLQRLARIVTRPDGTARFSRLNVALAMVIVALAGIVPAFASDPTSSSTTSTTARPDAPIVVGEPTTTTAAPATTSTTAAAAAVPTTPSTTAKPATSTTAAPSTSTTTAGKQPGVIYEEDSDIPVSASSNVVATPRSVAPNPAWPTVCNPNIALLMDRSASIGDPTYGGNYGFTQTVKAASSNFVRSLGGKNDGPRLYVNAFATNIKPVYQLWGGGFADIPASTNPFTNGSVGLAVERINATPFASPPSVGYGDYGTTTAGVGRGRTNWQGAMASVPSGANLMIIVTDGEPTWWNGANPATNNGATQVDDVLMAVSQANAIKNAGTRIVAVHVGQERGNWQTNLAAISGPAQNVDYFITDYAGLDSVLQRIAAQSSSCRTPTPPTPAPKVPGIQVTKTADKSVAQAGDTVTYTFTVKNTGDADFAPVTVNDDKLGSVGTIPSLAAGATTTLTKAFIVPAGSGAITNVVTACGTFNGTQTCDTATHTLNRIAIALTKTASRTNPVVGQTVVYTYVITNTGSVTLTNLTLNDDKLGAITIGSTSLAAGAATTGTATYTPTQADANTSITNVATVTGKAPDNSTVSTTATAVINVKEVGLSIVKTANKAYAKVGDVVTYSFAVTNTGTAQLTNVSVTDDKLGSVGSLGTLAPGATATLSKNYTVTAGSGPIVNVATATGTAPDGSTVTDTDTHTLNRIGLGVVKTASKTNPNVGETVTYTYVVTNTGDATLTNVTLSDDKLGAVTLGATTLAPGATTSGTAQYVVKAADAGTSITNVATATGKAPDNSTVTGTANATITVPPLSPSIGVTKVASTTTPLVGQTVTYTYTVTNTGDATLTNVTLSDDKLGAVTLGATTLAPGATTSGTATYVTKPADANTSITNIATATGTTPTGGTVTGTANATIAVKTASVTIEKTATKNNAVAGDVVVYSFKVTNTGSSTLAPVAVTDDQLGSIGTIATLAPGASSTLTKNFTVPEGSGAIVNVATATGTAPDGSKVTATDTHTLNRLSLGVIKTASNPSPNVGDTVTYTYIVTNTSNVTLTNVSLTDDKLGKVTLGTTTLTPASATTGTATYVVQPGDANTTIVNVATATGLGPDATPVTGKATATISVGAVQQTVDSVVPGNGIQVKGSSLAYTGDATQTLAKLAMVLLILGGGLVFLARRRRFLPGSGS